MAEKKGERHRLTVRLPKALHRQISHYALDEDRDVSDVIEQAVQEWWAAHPARSQYQKETPKE